MEYHEKARRSLFERRRDTNVVEGDPMRWARIDNGRLGVFSLVVLDVVVTGMPSTSSEASPSVIRISAAC